jgi:serine/threonine protein phosphatase PrpC
MIKAKEPHLIIHAASHPGMTGKQNEDRYRITPFFTDPLGKTPSLLAVLCDGIGGHRAGEIAAEIGVTIITESIDVGNPRQPLKTLSKAIRRANDVIYVASQGDSSRAGMGATCACAWVIGDRLYTANLGDSRIYLLREGLFFQLTTDHTWIQEALDAGVITDEMGVNHPNAHVIRRYLGSKKAPEPDFRLWVFDGEEDEDAVRNQGLTLQTGDILMLCSDGLTDLASDDEICDVIQNNPLEKVPGILIDLANHRGGHDNTTVVLMKVPPMKRQARKRRRRIGCLITLFVISILSTAVIIGMRLRGEKLTEVEPSSSVEVILSTTESEQQFVDTATPPAALDESMEILPGESIPQPSITAWPTNTISP